jgi:hypothetical protein
MHQREVHGAGNERAWWKAANIDPLKAARKLWKETRVNEGRIKPNEMRQGAAADDRDMNNRAPTTYGCGH